MKGILFQGYKGLEEGRGWGRPAPWYGWLGAVVGEGQDTRVGVHLRGWGEEGGGGSPHLLKFGLHFGEMSRVNLSGFIE